VHGSSQSKEGKVIFQIKYALEILKNAWLIVNQSVCPMDPNQKFMFEQGEVNSCRILVLIIGMLSSVYYGISKRL